MEQQSFWVAEEVPEEDSVVFQSYINRYSGEPQGEHGVFEPKKDQISKWSDAPNPECYASFGDGGVTATVNAYGDLMQFSSFLGVGDSGVFSADHRNTDDPFWLMKASEFMSVYKTQDDHDLARQVIRRVAKAWISTLQEADKRTSHVWPRAQDEGCNKYRLSEHVWIWKALKAIKDDRQRPSETQNLSDDNELTRRDAPETESNDRNHIDLVQIHKAISEDEKLFKDFDSDTVQRDILRRFTVENEVSKKRMLAMTRSSRETRFLLHASDTALFYGIDWGFILPVFDEVWNNTIEAQVHHNENSETVWDNSIRYALAIMMGTRKMQLNKKPPKELVKSAFGILFSTTSPNGLFHGQLEGTTKEPSLFTRKQYRDFYFHASFEIPYILLTQRGRIKSALSDFPDENPESSSKPAAARTTQQQNLEEVVEIFTQQPKRQSLVVDREYRSPTAQAPVTETVEARELSTNRYLGAKSNRPKVTAMKKSVPFNSLIDQSSIVDLEEEWLYNYPSFFGGKECTPSEFQDEALNLSATTESNNGGIVINRAAEVFIREYEHRNMISDPTGALDSHHPMFNNSDIRGWVVNIQKQKHLSKQQRASRDNVEETQDHAKLFDKLSKTRKAEEAKKRFIWLQQARGKSALICYVNSPANEQPAMSRFFDSHSHYDNQFLEETTMVLNVWNSELHLSFYRLIDKDYKPHWGIPSLKGTELPGNAKWKLAQASMGFRFSGDFFDRYWTCYMIEYIPGYGVREGERGKLPWKEEGWRQRKVLELLLFDRILKQIIRSTEDIFEMVKDELGDKRGVISFSALNSVEYLSSSTKWQVYQQILQMIEEELFDVLSTVSKWETREKDRGQERPRWTRNDERKYRGSIGKLQATTSRRIRDLQKQRSDIRSLKEQIIREQQQSRDNVSVIDAENVRLFTYVTVVFLPLGFAASIFSMSETPPGDVLKPMAVCSAVALALTFVALGNAKKVSTAINNYSHEKMNSSSLGPGREMQDSEGRVLAIPQREEAQAGMSEKNQRRGGFGTSHQINHKTSFSEHLWFWMKYVLIDLPARRVLVAYLDLKPPMRTDWIMYVHVGIGAIVLPMVLVTWIFRCVLYNATDLFQLAWGLVKISVKPGPPDKYKDLESYMDRWENPKNVRPLREKVMDVSKPEVEPSIDEAVT
ncbi:hypothetical protein BDP81DRAFT_406203 [Colletotrichum phormii]|uniref:Uncharacterized protein n=1 Tax=Colletotrichum phormii TaxID=359342 RepID=A0AAJ0EHU7_9PEZI|nr:uncharacterized protein BDP81DRAFT_406203 [Colletotrichum phormii]KAK1637300.1 hypothetical protein BDP81DRAFT_406203 [Colletotrichum phormii]